MSRPAAITGNYADLRFIKSRRCAQVVVEIPLEAADAFLTAFGAPNPTAEIPVALARLVPEKAEPKPPARKEWSSLSLAAQAGIRCADPDFRRWIGSPDEAHAADVVRFRCDVDSRSALDRDEAAAKRWLAMDSDFQRWKMGARI